MNFKITTNFERGTFHKWSGLPCQDACGYARSETVATVCLCDGAGSVENSEIASNAVANCLPDYIVESFDELFDMEEDKLKEQIIKVSTQFVMDADENTLAKCTMLMVAKHSDGRCIIMHIGDGAIFGLGNESEVLSKPENGEEINMTFFLSEKNAKNHLRIQKFTESQFHTVLLCSDGVSKTLYRSNEARPANAVDIMCRWLDCYSEEEVTNKIQIELESFFSNYSDDDMSVALMSWNNG